jgi:hypothetical protein
MPYFICSNILCECNYYLKHLQISSCDCNGFGVCEAFYCEESLRLHWWGNFKQQISFKFITCIVACALFQWNPCASSCKTKEYFSAKSHKTTNSPHCSLHFSSLRNKVCCVAMNDEVEVTIFQAMIQWILQLTLQWLLIHTCLSKSTVWRYVAWSCWQQKFKSNEMWKLWVV